MKIELNNNEIEQALVEYISSQGIDLSDSDVEVNMTAGRGGNGYSAALNITKPKAGADSVVEETTADEPTPFGASLGGSE